MKIKIKLLIFIVFFFGIGINEIFAEFNISLSEKLSIGNADSNYTYSIYVSNDGLSFFKFSTSNYSINKYSLSTPFDISTASTSTQSKLLVGRSGFFFTNDGTKLFSYGYNGSTTGIQLYDLSIARDLTTAVSSGNFETFYSGGNLITNYTSIFLNDEGDELFITSQSSGKIYRFNLSIPFLLSSKTYIEELSNINIVRGISFNNDGNILVGCYAGNCKQYQLDNYNLSTLNLLYSYNTTLSNEYGIYFSRNTNKFYIKQGSSGAYVYQFQTNENFVINDPELSCDTVLINYPYADSYQFDTGSTVLYDRDNVELNDFYGFSYEKNGARFEENLSNVKNVDDFTGSLDFNNLTSSGIVFGNLINPLSDFPILHIHSPDVGLSYLSMRGSGVKFKITDCSYYKDEQDDFFHLTDFDDIQEMYEVPVGSFINYNENPPLYMYDFFHKFGDYVNDICLVFDRKSSLNYVAIIEKLDYGQMTPQLIESEVCYDQENDIYYVDGEEYEGDPQDIQDPGKIDLIDNFDFFGNTTFNYSTSGALDLNLPVYGGIYYKDENLKTCYMFNNDGDFLYTVVNIFSIDFTLSETTDNDILKSIFFVPDLVVGVMQDAINSIFGIIGSFGKIEEGKDYCYLGTVYQVHYQSFFPEGGDVISSLEAYRVDSGEKTVVDYIFLFFYSFFMFSVIYLLFKND